jgi:polyisoprenoid-binding protein YceI
MKQLSLRLSVAVLLLSGAVMVRGQSSPTTLGFRLDPGASSIHWTLSTTVHTVHGSFRLKSGELRFDPSTGDASGLITVDTASGESGDGARDRRMHREVLESSTYPTITFRPTHFTGSLDPATSGPITVDGIFTLHGHDHPLRLTVTLHRTGDSLTAETRFDIPYVAWGLKDPSTFIFRVEKQVHIDVTAAATPVSVQASR